MAIGSAEKLHEFYFYQEKPAWSTFFRRFEVEKQYDIKPPQSFSVLVTSLDLYCHRWEISRINFLKIDVEGGELEVLKGCENLLKKGYIDYIQFEYGGTFLDAKITLKEVFEYLQKKRYSLFQITSKGLEYKPIFSPEYENYQYSNFLAVNERFLSNILGESPKMLDINDLCQKHSVKLRGAIHVGAYEGKEVAQYRSMGVEKTLFIEANPVVFERLQANVVGYPNVKVVNCAVSNIDGTVTMNLTSLDQSSSILPLKKVKEHYPNIKETNKITVKSRRIDTLLQELELNPSDFNIINLDIQGAELLALEGATNLLQHIDAINTEVNYEELYEGCALIEKIDDFLEKEGFERVATTTPYHPSWGDAFYVRKPVITMSTLGKNGRFANQLFQYAFLKIYAREHNFRVETPVWIGQTLFGHNDPPISKQLPVLQEITNDLAIAKVPHASEPFKNVDFWGYFQYNTKFYAPHKEYFRALFKPVTEIENRMQQAMHQLRSRGKTIIGIHLRRSDYGYRHFFVSPSEWYKEWLRGLWETLEEPVLFIASDELEKVLGDFAEYNPVTSKQLGVEFSQAEFYPDFYILSQCDIVGISNSSFSFAACMLNEKGKLFFRPHLPSKKLIPFDPWSSETIFRDAKVEANPIIMKRETVTESWPNWLPSKEKLEELLQEFLVLYDRRPIRDNQGGVRSVGAFSLWFFLQREKPKLVVESGVWLGLTTWLIEKTLPEAKIICIDPAPEVRKYTSNKASYYTIDFSEIDFSSYDIDNALVFFDDHQNAYQRVLQARSKGFKHLIFDDNYPRKNGSHLTLQECFNSRKSEAKNLQNILEKYEVFPPLYKYDFPVTNENVLIENQSLEISEKQEFEIIKREMFTYRWMTYANISDERQNKQQEISIEVLKNIEPPNNVSEVRSLEKEKLNNVSTKVLISFLAPRNIYRETIISSQEVFCGPDCETTFEGQNYRTINTPVGKYDIGEIIQQLPQSQQPELLIVKADSTKRNFPVNLQSLKCPKLLICGNTQHLNSPLNTLIEYAKEEKFDFIMSDHKRHHLHYFKEAGFEKVFWVPGFNINPFPKQANQVKYALSFVGQVGAFHPYRQYILSQIRNFGLPLQQFRGTQEQAAEVYASSLINLNISLNGDLNLRVFEVLASGGLLLTDKLSKQSGLDLLFKDGEHLLTFRNELELKHKIEFFLDHPETGREISDKGYEAFWSKHRPELNIKRVLDYIGGKEIESIFQIENEKRSVLMKSNSSRELNDRISIYEYIQEIHLHQTSLKGLFWPQVDSRIICDVVDLPRLDIHLILDNQETADTNHLFMQCEILDQITFRSYPTAKLTEQYDFLALTWDELERVGAYNLLKLVNFRWLIITDATNNLAEEKQKALDELLERPGFVKNSDRPLVYYWQRKADWGNLLLSQQKLLEAVKAFEWALQDNPNDVTALLDLGILCFKLNYLEQAEQLLQQAVSLERQNPLALEYLGRVLQHLNQYEKSKDILEHLVSINSQDLSSWLLLENCYRQLGLDEKALEVYRYCQNLKTGKILSETPIDIARKSTAKTKLKRILVINNIYPPQELGGYGRYISDFANILRGRGHTVQVLTSDAPYLGEIKTNEEYVDRSLLLTGNYEKLPPKSLENESEIEEVLVHNNQIIRNTISRYTPDVCLVGNIDFLSYKVFQPFLDSKIPIIHHVAFNLPNYPIPNTPQSPIYHLSACSEYVKQNILSNGYPLQDISVIYPGAFVNKFRMPVSPKFEKLRIAFASLVLPYKGPQTLVEAMSILHKAGIDFHCSIAGDTPDENFLNQLKSFTRSQGIEDKVDFLGYLSRPQLLNLYGTHNVFVFPSVWQEPFGISQIEGMAAGMLLITSGTGGASEVVKNNVSGLTFPPGNAESLAAALIKLVEDREGWKNIAMTGVKRAFEIFDIERSVDILESKFDEILKIRDGDEDFLQNRYQAELKENLRLREINLVIFPDWSHSEETVGLELQEVIKSLVSHPDKSKMTLLVDNSNIAAEDADLILSSVVMNLLMEEDLEVDDGPEIILVGKLSQIQWLALIPQLQGRIKLENENVEVMAKFKLAPLSNYDFNSLSETQFKDKN
ncbi:hypothetical protein CYANOKiyG1_58420 [Okeania sp. KiyG1]|nr:hypothetical protein CYANOKiyG1_58420 [Okeania sp. KiyG1]